MGPLLLELMYILVGLILMMLGLRIFMRAKDLFSASFWFVFGLIFLLGKYLPPFVVGLLLICCGLITLAKKVKKTVFQEATEEERQQRSLAVGSLIFIPALSIGIVAFLVIQFTPLGGLVGLGIGSLVGLLLTLTITKTNPRYIVDDTSSLLQQLGPVLMLPQLLGSLGAIFTKAGIGTLIADSMSSIIPAGDKLLGVILYCVSMAVFTVVMGNAFASFAIITAGIGLPFVLGLGGNPVIVGALGLTAGYCGTLMTPMAANFNVLPATILDMKDTNLIMRTQLPVALFLLTLHIVLMYFWAF